jgi:hypothetical protein
MKALMTVALLSIFVSGLALADDSAGETNKGKCKYGDQSLTRDNPKENLDDNGSAPAPKPRSTATQG